MIIKEGFSLYVQYLKSDVSFYFRRICVWKMRLKHRKNLLSLKIRKLKRILRARTKFLLAECLIQRLLFYFEISMM